MKRHYENDDTEEMVHVAQATCENEEDIQAAIDKTIRDLQGTSIPSGYTKVDEEFITTVYKLPENEIIYTNNSNSKYNKEINEYYDENNDNCINNVNIQTFNGGKIENYFQNEISQDGQYLVSMTHAKKIMDEKEKNLRKKFERNNYYNYKEEIQVNENDDEGEGEGEEQGEGQENKYNYSHQKIKNKYNKDNNGNYEEKRNRIFTKIYNIQEHSMEFPAEYHKNKKK